MSHIYKPAPTGSAGVDRELERLQTALNGAHPLLYFQPLHAEPAKLRDGMLAVADGSDWNPGSGEGLYRYSASLAGWVFIG